MVTLGKLQSSYKQLISNTKLVLRKHHLKLRDAAVIVETGSNGLATVTLNEPLHFDSWRWRAGSTMKLDIVVATTETIRLSDCTCVRSTVHLNYFLRTGEKVDACDAIHYDFQDQVQARHPVFHAQNAAKPLAEMPESFRNLHQTANALNGRHQGIRIPTAFMNLAGVFVMLIADHADKDVFEEFWKHCGSFVSELPKHTSGSETARIIKDQDFSSCGWYAH